MAYLEEVEFGRFSAKDYFGNTRDFTVIEQYARHDATYRTFHGTLISMNDKSYFQYGADRTQSIEDNTAYFGQGLRIWSSMICKFECLQSLTEKPIKEYEKEMADEEKRMTYEPSRLDDLGELACGLLDVPSIFISKLRSRGK